MRAILADVLGQIDVRQFTWNFDGHKWQGYIYLKRNSLMGTLFSFFDKKFYIYRGYPKIKYAGDSRVLDQEAVAQEKVDGTNLGFFLLPNGKLMAKTRMVPRWDVGSKEAEEGSWLKKFKRMENSDYVLARLKDLCQEDYMVFGELYGYLNPGEFIKYSKPLGFKVFDVVDLRTMGFLPPEKVETLIHPTGLELVEDKWSGILSFKEIERIEFELKDELKLDGCEGFVGKWYDEQAKDTFFAKLKTADVKEKCWGMAHTLIPGELIRKAIRKAQENLPGETDIGVVYNFAYQELEEEVEKELIEASADKIKRMIRLAVSPSDTQLYEIIKKHMIELHDLGINMEDKGKVLSMLHSRIGDVHGGKLYKAYLQILLEMKGKW